MTTEIKVPQLPESVSDATLVAWHKKPGDAVRRDENLADLETDKVVLEVPSPANGVLRELKVADGTVVTSGQVLAVIEEGATAATSAAPAPAPAAAAESAAAAETKSVPAKEDAAGKDKLSPSVRRLVEENRLDPGTIPSSGRDGRLTKSDVVGFLGQQGVAAPVAPPAAAAGARTEHRVAMTRLRQRIAQRMVEAQSTQALLT